jgi:hypothetical protein
LFVIVLILIHQLLFRGHDDETNIFYPPGCQIGMRQVFTKYGQYQQVGKTPGEFYLGMIKSDAGRHDGSYTP